MARKSSDEESGISQPLYPAMTESPELRWAFIRKIYSILTVQILLTIVVASIVVFVPHVTIFFVATKPGFVLYIFLLFLPIILIFPMNCYSRRHPVNFILLGLFTLALSFAVGLSCAFTSGKVVLEAAVLTAIVVISLTAYTFWAAKRGQDFNFLGPFLFSALMILFFFGFIQLFFPLGKISSTIYGGLGALIFSGYIIYDTNNLIRRYSYDEYIWAAVMLYLDILNLFTSLLTLFRSRG